MTDLLDSAQELVHIDNVVMDREFDSQHILEAIDTGENHTLVAEVRDEYNDPVSGVVVNASVVAGDPGRIVSADQATSDADGRVAFTCRAASPGDAAINVSFGSDPGAAETVYLDSAIESRRLNFHAGDRT